MVWKRWKCYCPNRHTSLEITASLNQAQLQFKGCFFIVPTYNVLSAEKLIQARLGVSRMIFVSVDSPSLGFPYFNFLGEDQ